MYIKTVFGVVVQQLVQHTPFSMQNTKLNLHKIQEIEIIS